MDIGSILFDAVCFFLVGEGDITKKIITQLLELITTLQSASQYMETPLITTLTKMLQTIITDDIDPLSNGDIQLLINKYASLESMKDYQDKFDVCKTLYKERTTITTRRVNMMHRRLQNFIVWAKQRQSILTMLKSNNAYMYHPTEEAQDELLEKVIENAKDITTSLETSAGALELPVDEINLSDKKSLTKALTHFKKIQQRGVFKTGLQGLNRLLNPVGGFTKGEFITVAALTHNYKSGILMDVVRWLVTLNTPGTPPGVIPTIVFISLENEIYQNMMIWFKTAYAHMFKKDPSGLSDEEIIDCIIQTYSKQGFKVLVFRRLGNYFDFNEYAKLMDKLLNSGHYIIASVIDYIALMKYSTQSNNTNSASQLQELYRTIKDFNKHLDIMTFTGAQLSGAAEEIVNSGMPNPVKRFTAGCLKDCKGIGQETDILLFMHIEESRSGIPYLTFKIAKHKYVTMPKQRFIAYRFTQFGIMDDVEGNDQSVIDITAAEEQSETVNTEEEMSLSAF